MTNSIAERERRLARLAEELLPEIVRGLQRGEEALKIAKRLSEDATAGRRVPGAAAENAAAAESQAPAAAESSAPEADLKTIYRWVTIVEERLERKRRRVGVMAAALLWVGFLGIAAGALRLTLGVPIPAPTAFLVAGVVVVGAGILVWRKGKAAAGVTADEVLHA